MGIMPASLPQHHCKIRIKIVGGHGVKSLVNALGVVQESAVEKTGKVVRKAAPQVKVVIIIMPASLPLTKKPTPSPTKKPTSPTKKNLHHLTPKNLGRRCFGVTNIGKTKMKSSKICALAMIIA